MAVLVIQAYGSLVEVDILQLSRFPCPCVDICDTIAYIILGIRMANELDLKMTLGMAERRKTESPPDEDSWEGRGQRFPISVRPKVSRSWSLAVTCLIGHSTGWA